jgi:uncharacterized SAM-binding protein YcdF (DUF218 family)
VAILLVMLDLVAVAAYLALVQVRVPPLPGQGAWPAAVVFFSDFGRHGDLGPESLDRVAHAARLYHSGRVERILCVGGRRNDPARYGSGRMAAALVAAGVPADAVMSENESFDTRTNWSAARRILDRSGWSDPLLVSSALHLHRIAAVAEGPYEWALAPTRTAFEALVAAPGQTWYRVHREWVAWASMWLLPADSHRDLIRRWRDFTSA